MRHKSAHVKTNRTCMLPLVIVKHSASRYNRSVKIRKIHNWQMTTSEARDLQLQWAGRVIRQSDNSIPQLIAGVDISVKRYGMARAAVVVLSYPNMELVEVQTSEGVPPFPYVPGLLSFREAPLILAACEQLKTTPGLIMVDGQGIAHPRRFGIASHLGLILDIPTIGCAKSRLCGVYQTPAEEVTAFSELTDNGEVIGAVLRTKTGTNPLYISIGHRIDLPTAIQRVLECCRGYRLPQPTRLAHLAAGGNLKMTNNKIVVGV